MLIVTTNGIPGYRIEAVLGQVMGMTVRSANLGSNIAAGFRSLGGGEHPELTNVVYESRNEVMNRMWSECLRRGGNAVVGMLFDTSDLGKNFTEVCAFGTAVVVTPIPEGEPGATPQSIARAAGGEPRARELAADGAGRRRSCRRGGLRRRPSPRGGDGSGLSAGSERTAVAATGDSGPCHRVGRCAHQRDPARTGSGGIGSGASR
ncbi:MAG TPA: YbjQ family protein [Propionibacterium sp.]|nr:YbjQ family protein [Propionibacterium sp.]